MAASTMINGFPVPLSSNTGWRSPDGANSVLGSFRVSRWGEVFYKDVSVGVDSDYGNAVLANAVARTSIADYAALAAADLLLMAP